MKTRVEQGSDHVTITCSKGVAYNIGAALVSTSEDYDSFDLPSKHINKIGSALERYENFEEEEPSRA